jgi:hypothetical protein
VSLIPQGRTLLLCPCTVFSLWNNGTFYIQRIWRQAPIPWRFSLLVFKISIPSSAHIPPGHPPSPKCPDLLFIEFFYHCPTLYSINVYYFRLPTILVFSRLCLLVDAFTFSRKNNRIYSLLVSKQRYQN